MAIGDQFVGSTGGVVRALSVGWDFDKQGKIPNAVTPTGVIIPKDVMILDGLIFNRGAPGSASGNIEVGWLATDQSLNPPGSKVGVGLEVADRNGLETISAANQQRGFARVVIEEPSRARRFASDVEITLFASNTAGSSQNSGRILLIFKYILD